MLIDGQQVSPEDVIAHVACDLPVRDVLSMVQFGGATIVDPTAVPEDGDDAEEPAGDFAKYSAKVQEALTAAGIATMAQAALYIRDQGSLEAIEGVSKTAAKLIAKEIAEAGLPVE
jgi:hypothetical protein